MKPFIALHSVDLNCTYEVDTAVIAMHKHMAVMAEWSEANPALDVRSPEIQLEITRKVSAAFEDEQVIRQFAHTLRWIDIASHARLIEWGGKMPDPKAGLWSEPYDEPKVAAMPETMLSGAPLDMYLSLLWQQNSRIVADVMTDTLGNVTGALILVTGNQEQVQAYMAVCAQLDQQMANNPDGATRPARRPYRH